MGSIHRTVHLKAAPDEVWAALRDWPAVHERLVRGFVVETRLDGDDRIVTFFNGVTVRELLVDLDDAKRRLVWSVAGGSYSHYNASAQVLDGEGSGSRLVWIADFLPHEMADRQAGMMDRGIQAIRDTIDG